jgi:hypothetical protein
MSYKVHRLNVDGKSMQYQLENYLNLLKGEVVSIIPNVRPTFQLMGATAKLSKSTSP